MALFHRLRKDCSGAAAAEMVLMVPLLSALIFTTFEGGHYMWAEHKVVKGVRDGARFAGRLPFSSYDCSTNAISNANGEVDKIKNLTRTGQLSGGTATVVGWEDSDITVTINCATGQDGVYSGNSGNAPRVTVSTTVSYPSLFGALGFDTAGINLRASAEAAVMGI